MHRFLGILERVFVAIDVMNHVVLVAPVFLLRSPPKLAVVGFIGRVHLSVERGEEEVLQDGFVIDRVFGGGEFVALFEQSLEFDGIEEVVRKQSFFLHKPAKDQARDEANEVLRFVSLGVLDVFGLGELDVVACPEIPVGDFLEKAFVEFGTVEGLLPGGLEFRPVGEVMLLVQLGEGEIEQDFNVGAVRIGDADVFDERDFFEDVLRFVAFVETAGNDGEGERVAVAEQQHRGHAEEFVDFTGDARKLGAGVFGVFQGDGEEEVGFDDGIIEFAFAFEHEVALTH